jgi:hypothetical protein
LALLTLLAACVPATQSTGVLLEEQVVDGLTIGFEAVESPELNAAQELFVTLSDADGNPVENADVYFDLTMPAMPMGTNRPVAEHMGEGRYRVGNAVFDMTGDWEIFIVVEHAGVERRAMFTRTVNE